MPSLLVGINNTGVVTQWNKHAAVSTGVKRENAIGQKLEKLLPEYKDHIDQINKNMSQSKQYKVQKISIADGEQVRYCDLMAYPLEAKGVKGAVVRIDDVTELVHMEKMIIQTEKMKSVGALAAGMAHEINNPLGAITQGIQNAFRDDWSRPTKNEHLFKKQKNHTVSHRRSTSV